MNVWSSCGGQRTSYRSQFFALPCKSQGMNSSYQAWQKMALSFEPTGQSCDDLIVTVIRMGIYLKDFLVGWSMGLFPEERRPSSTVCGTFQQPSRFKELHGKSSATLPGLLLFLLMSASILFLLPLLLPSFADIRTQVQSSSVVARPEVIEESSKPSTEISEAYTFMD